MSSLQEAEALLAALSQSYFTASSSLLAAGGRRSPEQANKKGPDYETRYKTLIERIPAIVFVAPLEAGSGEAYISPQIETILGFTQSEWLDEPLRWYWQVHPDDKARWSSEAACLFASGEPLLSNYRVLARDGHVVWFRCDARMVHSAERKPSFIHGICFDVTELKETEASLQSARVELEIRVAKRTRALALVNAQLEEEIAGHKRTALQLLAAKESAEAAERIKSQFLANMSHEMRTPMNGVLGMTNLVLNTQLTPEQRAYLSVAKTSAESLLSIIDQLLDFSQSEAGQFQLSAANFNLRKSLAILTQELCITANAKGLELTCAVSPESPDFLRGDLERLREVLSNLIGNAIKFTHAGKVSLNVTFERLVKERFKRSCILRFSVADTGIGIPKEKLKAIFEPFTQADGSATREYGGTGLGLTISRRVVETLGGHLEVQSEVGRGSTFTFTAQFEMPQDHVEMVCNESLSSLR